MPQETTPVPATLLVAGPVIAASLQVRKGDRKKAARMVGTGLETLDTLLRAYSASDGDG